MELPLCGLLYVYRPHESDVRVLRQEFDERLIPLARRCGVIRPSEGRKELRQAWYRGAPSEGAALHPREVAAYNLGMVEVYLTLARSLSVEGHETLDDDAPDPDSLVHDAALWIPHLHGYLTALLDLKAENVRRGANGRRLIGATSRERVRSAALPHRGLMSRDEAAFRISPLVGKSPATIRKMLSALFPGKRWDEPEAD